MGQLSACYTKAHIRRKIRGVRHKINENKRCECEINKF